MIRVSLEKFSKELGDFATYSLAAQKKAVVSGLMRSIPDLVAASPVDTGLYASSWDVTADEARAILGNYAPYAGIIERGARPFTPPLGPLLAWAKRVLGDSSRPPKYSPQVWALAVHTQKKIEAEGMAPRHVLENMLPKIFENIREELKHARA